MSVEDDDKIEIHEEYSDEEKVVLLSKESGYTSSISSPKSTEMLNDKEIKERKRESNRKKILKKQVRRMVYQKKKSGKYFNIDFKNVPLSRRYIDFYHFMLDLAWWKVFLTFLGSYLLIHVCFGLLYFFGALVDITTVTTYHTNYFMVFVYCFFFSVDIMQTNGTFGIIVPTGIYQRSVVGAESFFCYFFETLWIAFILGKFARPSKMKKNFLFSKKAILYRNMKKYSQSNLVGEFGVDESKYYSFAFRFSNIRCYKSPQMDVQIDLLLLLWRDEKFFKIYHLDYIVYEQTARSKNVQFANPLLPIPHQIRHTITEKSPLFPFIRSLKTRRDNDFEEEEEENIKTRFELVCVVEGIDSATSDNYQGFFSWTERETFFDHIFEPCCFYSTRKNRFLVDYKMFHRIRRYTPEDMEEVINL